MGEGVLYQKDNSDAHDYVLKDKHAGAWIEVDNLAVWIRRDSRGPGVQIEVYRSKDIEYCLDSLFVEEVE